MNDGSAGDIVRRYFDMWNTGDTAIADQILHPGWVDHAHPEVTGPDAVKQAVRSIRAARPELRFTVHSVLGGDDLVAVVGSAGQAGDLVWLFRLTGGLLTEMWTYRRS